MDLDIWEILASELNGEKLTGDEQICLREWLEKDEKNLKAYHCLKDFYESSQTDMIGVDVAYRKVLQRVKWKRNRKWNLFRRIGYVAAVFVVVVFTGWLLRVSEQSVYDELAGNGEEILTGSIKAVLILPSGELVSLDSGRNIALRSGNVTISNQDNILQYVKEIAEVRDSVVQYNILSIPRGGEYRLALADGTNVWLNSETELRFPECFVKEERRVYLKGEAYFEVSRNERQPFVVCAEGIEITVLGTAFNVSTYSGKNVYTTLVRGCVRVATQADGKRYKLLSPAEQAVGDPATGEICVSEVNTSLYTSWHEGYYTFQEEGLEEIMETLSRWYDMNVSFEKSDIRSLHFTGRIKRYDHIGLVLEMLKLTNEIEFDIKGKSVFVKKR